MLRFLDRHFEELIAGIGLVIMSTMVFAQVVMRYLFQAPMSWSDEIAVYCMLWSVYLSASWAVRERAHIRVLNLIQLFPKPLSNWLIYLSDFIWLIASVVICWQGVLLHLSLWERRYESPVLAIDQNVAISRRCGRLRPDDAAPSANLCPTFPVRRAAAAPA